MNKGNGVKSVFHILQLNAQRLGGHLYLNKGKHQWDHQKDQAYAKDEVGPDVQFHIDQEHGHCGQQKTDDGRGLHVLDDAQPFSQLADLLPQRVGRGFLKLFVELPDQGRYGQIAGIVGQHGQGDGRKKESGNAKGKLHVLVLNGR